MPTQKDFLRQILDTVDTLRSEVDSEMPLQMVAVLLTIAAEEDVPMAEVARVTNLSQASISRNVAALGMIHRKKKPGYGLVDAYEDPMERRRKLLRLTPKGRSLINKITKQIADRCRRLQK